MKIITLFCTILTLVFSLSTTSQATNLFRVTPRKNLTDMIPVIEVDKVTESVNFEKVTDVAEYGGATWNNVIGISRGISVEEAQKIASSDSKISYFFYMKSGAMSLNANDGNFRAFRQGDAVFFSGSPTFGAAIGFADGYIKKRGI